MDFIGPYKYIIKLIGVFSNPHPTSILITLIWQAETMCAWPCAAKKTKTDPIKGPHRGSEASKAQMLQSNTWHARLCGDLLPWLRTLLSDPRITASWHGMLVLNYENEIMEKVLYRSLRGTFNARERRTNSSMFEWPLGFKGFREFFFSWVKEVMKDKSSRFDLKSGSTIHCSGSKQHALKLTLGKPI